MNTTYGAKSRQTHQELPGEQRDFAEEKEILFAAGA